MKIGNQRDFWSGLMFIAVGAAFAVGSLDYSFGNSARPGPAYFPFGLGVLLAILAGVVLLGAFKARNADGNPVGAFAWKPLLIILGAITLFGFLLPRAGMFITLPILVIGSAMASDEFKLKEALLNATILTVMSWAVFSKGLGLTIPLLPAFLGGA